MLSSTFSAYGHFKNIPPIILRTADRKQFKFDIDYLQDSGVTTGKPTTYINKYARNDFVIFKKVKLINT